MPQSLSAFVVAPRIPVWALQTGLFAVRRVDQVRILLADVGEAGVVGGRVGGERPVVDVGHCGRGRYRLINGEVWYWVLQKYQVRVALYLAWSCSSCPPWSPAGCSRRSAADWTSCPVSQDSNQHLWQEAPTVYQLSEVLFTPYPLNSSTTFFFFSSWLVCQLFSRFTIWKTVRKSMMMNAFFLGQAANPKSRDQFTIIKSRKKQQIFIFPKLKPVNIWLFIINLSQ